MDALMDREMELADQDGNIHPVELLDLVVYQEEEYLVLPKEDPEQVVILRIERTEGSQDESLVSVEDEAVLDAVFAIFRERAKDRFFFAEQ